MNENNFNKGIQELKNIRLTHAEKESILHAVFQTPVGSPYAKPSVWSFTYARFAYVGAFLFLFVCTGGIFAYADEGSVPGDLLYPIKTHITEPFHAALAVTDEAKAQWEATKAMRRLDEAKRLDQNHKLTPELNAEIENDFTASQIAFQAKINTLGTTTQREDIQNSFEKMMRDHEDIIGKFPHHEDSIDQENTHTEKQVDIKISSTIHAISTTKETPTWDETSSTRIHSLKQPDSQMREQDGELR